MREEFTKVKSGGGGQRGPRRGGAAGVRMCFLGFGEDGKMEKAASFALFLPTVLTEGKMERPPLPFSPQKTPARLSTRKSRSCSWN